MKLAFVIPGDINQLTGGYGYDREIMARLPRYGIDVQHIALSPAFPFPGDDDLRAARDVLMSLSSFHHVLCDGLAYGALPHEMIAALPYRPHAMVHHPLGLEAGLSATARAVLLAQEKVNLSLCDHIFVSSAFTAHHLEYEFDIAPQRLSIAEPGTAKAPRVIPRVKPAIVSLLAVGSLIPRKAYHHLIAALAPLRDLSWHLTIIGAMRDVDYVKSLHALIDETGLQERITCAGEYQAAQLNAAYEAADIVISASLYEGYGMSLTETLMRGLPLIASTGGAAAFTVADGAGLKIPPDDVPALTHALKVMMEDEEMRHSYAEAAWGAGQALPTWDETTMIFADYFHKREVMS